ncbi:hypothetical protein BV22DRAFT_402973 [Leucogyrophana mollusca]|uniref:Uncharacterized protein n=1 Tax=Leucogyrophana mollusca TaxID=85980 RepID=A0ACB8BKQ8_9AGAM|nr:hypothetical protein BV22DRAFT_402973 [Leucogyrophana mollusca]
MNHPRYSVLSLFDPLNAPSTPRREVITPDSGSDKENAEPAHNLNSENAQSYLDDDKLTMSAFFNRVHAQSKQYAPAAFRKRLVDIGDVTVSVDEASELMGDLTITRGPEESAEEEDLSSDDELHLEDLTDGHISASRRQPPSSTDVPRTPQQASNTQRTPLAELSPDATPVPLKTLSGVSDATPAITIDHHKSPATAVRTNHLTFAPPGSPLASVINAINLTARRNEESVRPQVEEPVTRDLVAHNGTPTPSITVSPSVDDPLVSSTAHLLPSPSAALLTNAHLFESTSFPSPPSTRFEVPEAQNSPVAPAPNSSPSRLSPRARPRSHTTTSSLDPRRTSVDLHSSFNWQLQCPEASFDLLNDRISFFGQDSFLGETDDFDMQAEEEMMEALAKRVREKEASEEKVKPKRRESTDGNGLRASIRCSPRESRVEKVPEVEAGSNTAPASPAVVQNGEYPRLLAHYLIDTVTSACVRYEGCEQAIEYFFCASTISNITPLIQPETGRFVASQPRRTPRANGSAAFITEGSPT